MTPRYELRDTVARSLAVWARNLGPAVILGALLFAPSIYYTVRAFAYVDDGRLTEANLSAWLFLGAVVAYVGDQLLAAPIVYGVVQELDGAHASVLRCVAQGLRRLVPVVATVALVVVCVLLAAYPLVVPALVLATGLYVAVPSAVCERRGALRAVTRSLTLTEGHRARVLVLMLSFWGVRLAAKELLVLTLAPERPGQLRLLFGAWLAVDFAFGTVGAVMQAVSYARLRELREGTSTRELARVFA